MKAEPKSFVSLEFTLTMNHSELEMLNKLCSYGICVAEPITGKKEDPNTDPARLLAWGEFLNHVRQVTEAPLARFRDAREVFEGRKIATDRKRPL